MFAPPAFRIDDREKLFAFIAAHPLGLLISMEDGAPSADLAPFLVEPDFGASGRLRAHVSRANPLWRRLQRQPEALVVFQGENAYVSPSHYPSKPLHGKVVPTWNYSMAQVRGRALVHDDPDWVLAQASALTDLHETARPAPWAASDAPDDYMKAQRRLIVGVEILIDSMVGKFKLSQNRDAADRTGVSEGLAQEQGAGAKAVAARMMERDVPEELG